MDKFKRTFGFIFSHPLGRKHPFKALYRFIAWHMVCRIYSGKLIPQNFVHPVKFLSKKGLTGITGNIYTGLHEFNDMGFLLHFLREGDVFFDIGANVGSYTLLASGVCKAKSTAVEPVASTFDILTANIALNSLHDKVTLINAGAGAMAGIVMFSGDEDTTNHVIAPDENAGISAKEVQMITVDSLSINNFPALIKIDVEGFETEVLKGMSTTLQQPNLKAIIIELNGSGGRYGFNEEDIHKLLIANNFWPHQYDPFKRTLGAAETYGSYNTIYCRDLPIINNRLQSAGAFKIMGETI